MAESASTKNIAKNTIFLYIRMLVVMVVSLFTARVILRGLGSVDYGIYNVVGGVVTLVAFLNSALTASTGRFLTYELGRGNKNILSNIFAASLNLHICVAAVAVIFGETFGLWYLNNKMVIPIDRMYAAQWVFQFSIINIVFCFTQVPYSSALISHENMSIYAYVGLYEAFSKLIIAYLISVSPFDKLIFYALILMLNSTLICMFYRFYTHKKYEECRFAFIKDKQLYKKLLSYSGWDLFGGLSSVCQSQGISMVLNLFFGPVVNAARAIAVQIQGALDGFVSNFLVAARPQVIKNYAKGDVEGMYKLSFFAAKVAYFLMFALMVPVFFELKIILSIWLGDEVPENTYIFTIIIMLTGLMQTFHKASLMPYHAIGRIMTGNIIGGSLMILSLPATYLVLRQGAEAYWAFIIIFITNTSQQFITWVIVNSYQKMNVRLLFQNVYLRCFIVTIMTVIPTLIVKQYINVSPLTELLIVILASESSFIASLWFLGLNNGEKQLLLSYWRTFKSKFAAA